MSYFLTTADSFNIVCHLDSNNKSDGCSTNISHSNKINMATYNVAAYSDSKAMHAQRDLESVTSTRWLLRSGGKITLQDLSSKELGETLEDVLDTVGKDKKKMIIEKEELDDLKEEMKDYQESYTSCSICFGLDMFGVEEWRRGEKIPADRKSSGLLMILQGRTKLVGSGDQVGEGDKDDRGGVKGVEDVQNLKEVTKLAKEAKAVEVEVKESKAAKRLSRTVNRMISKMDAALAELEKKEMAKKESLQKVVTQSTSWVVDGNLPRLLFYIYLEMKSFSLVMLVIQLSDLRGNDSDLQGTGLDVRLAQLWQEIIMIMTGGLMM
ncbi:hypothetical protein J6590_055844 [Homalodisca vitripennis]|nr:hypothetical protein J6590_055844 [Homalodisca vitripennis]